MIDFARKLDELLYVLSASQARASRNSAFRKVGRRPDR